jgi:hypothetical protein
MRDVPRRPFAAETGGILIACGVKVLLKDGG